MIGQYATEWMAAVARDMAVFEAKGEHALYNYPELLNLAAKPTAAAVPGSAAVVSVAAKRKKGKPHALRSSPSFVSPGRSRSLAELENNARIIDRIVGHRGMDEVEGADWEFDTIFEKPAGTRNWEPWETFIIHGQANEPIDTYMKGIGREDLLYGADDVA